MYVCVRAKKFSRPRFQQLYDSLIECILLTMLYNDIVICVLNEGDFSAISVKVIATDEASGSTRVNGSAAA
jgi:hypothetical protein